MNIFAAESWMLDVPGDYPAFLLHVLGIAQSLPCALTPHQASTRLQLCTKKTTPSDQKELDLHANLIFGSFSEKTQVKDTISVNNDGVYLFFHGVDTQVLRLVLR